MRETRRRGSSPERGAWTRRSLFGFVLRIVVVLGVDGERLFGDLGLLEHFLGGRGLFLDALGLFLDLLPTVAEERAADVRPLLRLRRAVVARERDAARVLGAREDLADGHAGVRGVVAHDRSDVLIAGTQKIDETPPNLRLEEPDELAITSVYGEKPFLLAQLAFSAGAVFREGVGRSWGDQTEDARLSHVLDEEARLRPCRRREGLGLVLLQRGHPRVPAESDRVVRLDLQDLGERGLGLIEAAELDERPAQPVARFEVLGGGFDELLVEVRGARPVRFERGGGGLVGECARAKTSIGYLWHGASSNA